MSSGQWAYRAVTFATFAHCFTIRQDNPGGGAPGDGTVILEMLIEQRIKGVGYASVWDPQAIGLCRAAGEGGELQLRFGGKTHHLSG